MESVQIALDIPETFSRDCEAYGISEAEMLQMFICHIYALCAIAGGNESLLISKTTQVLKDFLKTATLVPIRESKKSIVMSTTQTIVGMTMTKTLPWSAKVYSELINKAYQQLITINNSNR